MGRKNAAAGAEKARAGGAGPVSGSGSDAIDRDYLRRFTLGSDALEREVLCLFAGQMPLYLEQLRAATTPKQWADAAHTIKGSAAAIGARRAALVAEMAERIDVSAMPESRVQAVEAVAAALEEVLREIDRVAPPE